MQPGVAIGGEGTPLHHRLPGQQSPSCWGEHRQGGPTVRVKPVALLVHLNIHPGARAQSGKGDSFCSLLAWPISSQ